MRQKDISESIPETRKDEVIRIAARLFAAKGYHATTLDEIAEEIGVTKPALYYYITSKEDILRSIVNRIMEPMEEVYKVGCSDLQPRDKIERMIRILVKFSAERRETTLLAFEQANILPKRSRDALRRREKDVEDIVQQTLKDGIADGSFTVLNVKITCFAILAVANNTYRWFDPAGNLTPSQISDQYINILERGYLKPELKKTTSMLNQNA
jgi:TetR/AcrR family transcriptional regulator, cholesterol catabolism regulator